MVYIQLRTATNNLGKRFPPPFWAMPKFLGWGFPYRVPWVGHHETSYVCPVCSLFAEDIKLLERTTLACVTDLVGVAHMYPQEADPTLEVVVCHPVSGIRSWVPLIVLGAIRVVGGGMPGRRALLCSQLTPRLHNASAH